MAIPPTKLPLVIYQGVPFDDEFTWLSGDDCGEPMTPVSLVGATASMQAKDADGNVVLDLNTTDGTIVLGGTLGTVRYQLNDTSALDWTDPLVYILKVTFPGGAIRMLTFGPIELKKVF